jgi:hypothetical protein
MTQGMAKGHSHEEIVWDRRRPARVLAVEHGSREIYVAESCYQATTGEDIADWKLSARYSGL